MKKFAEWIVESHPEAVDESFVAWFSERHPEMFDEGILDSLGKNRFLRNAVATAAFAGAGLGMANRASAADADSKLKPSATSKAFEDDQDDDFVYDTSSEEGIAAIKAKMLRMAQKVPMKTSTHNIGGKEVRVSRGSAHMSGGNVIPPSKFDPKTGGQNKSRQPTKILPQLPAGPTSSPDFGGAVE